MSIICIHSPLDSWWFLLHVTLQVKFVWWLCVTFRSTLHRIPSFCSFWWSTIYSWFVWLEMLLCFSVFNTNRGLDQVTSSSIHQTNNCSSKLLFVDRVQVHDILIQLIVMGWSYFIFIPPLYWWK